MDGDAQGYVLGRNSLSNLPLGIVSKPASRIQSGREIIDNKEDESSGCLPIHMAYDLNGGMMMGRWREIRYAF